MKVADVFEKYRALFGSVPKVGQDFVCHFCLGPVDPAYDQCFSCHRLFNFSHDIGGDWLEVPPEVRDHVVPMTAALMPSPWYTYLYQYKRGYLDAYGPIIASLAHTYLSHHEQHVHNLLGGEPTHFTVVPSTRGFGFAEQPLVRALSLIPPVAGKLVQTLVHVPGTVIGRQKYNPAAFGLGPTVLTRSRVLLIDDAWITGGKATSAAGALLREGAVSVAILVLGRAVDAGYWSDAKHPYRVAMQLPYDPAPWPR